MFGVLRVARWSGISAVACLSVLGVALVTGCGDTSSGAASGGSSASGGSGDTGGSSASGGSGNSANGGSGQGGTTTGGVSTGQGGSAGAPAAEPFPIGFGSPEPFVTGLTRPVRIGFKQGALYFTEMGLADGSMSRLARRNAAGNVETLFAGNMVAALFLDDEELFFVERGTDSVFRMKYATPSPQLFATTPAALTVGDIARVGETMWLTEFATDGMTTGIATQGRSSGPLVESLPAQARGFIFTYMAVAPSGQVYISTQGGGLFKGSTSGALAVTVPAIATNRLGTDANFVYFGSLSDGRILRQAHSTTMSPELVADGQSVPFAVTADAGGIYWSNGPDCMPDVPATGSVVARALSGGAPVTVAVGERCPQAITTDAEYVYWIRENPADGVGDDAIVRAKKLR